MNEMLDYTRDFIAALIFTITIETGVLFLVARKLFHVPETELSIKKLLFAGCFASFATLPYVWYIFPILLYRSYALAVGVSEICIFLIEAVFYSAFLHFTIKKSLVVSSLANVASLILWFLILKIVRLL